MIWSCSQRNISYPHTSEKQFIKIYLLDKGLTQGIDLYKVNSAILPGVQNYWGERAVKDQMQMVNLGVAFTRAKRAKYLPRNRAHRLKTFF